MSVMKTKRASSVLNYNPGTFDNYRSKYRLQHRALAHTEQQAIKGPQNFKCKTNDRIYIKKNR